MTLAQDALSTTLSAAVLTAMDDAAATEILPRWRSLTAGQVRTKSGPWDLVTDADVEAERLLTARLRELVDVPVVGEEATAENPALLDVVGDAEACWLVDPVDGTRNFVEGSEVFACMVALVVDGAARAAWITHPAVHRTISAAAGAGATRDGSALPRLAAPGDRELRGAVSARTDSSDGADVLARAAGLGPCTPIRFCAGWDYFDVATGATDYVSFTRTLPWDHAPGTLIAREAGLRAARPATGAEYSAGERGTGVLTAHPQVWSRVAETLDPAAARRAAASR